MIWGLAGQRAAEAQRTHPRFVAGSIARHVLVMAMTGAIGTMALFLVDLASLFFLAQLKNTAVTAAMGYASSIVYFAISASLGGGVAASALVARSLGAGDQVRARNFASSNFMFSLVSASLLAASLAVFADDLLALINAEGEARQLAAVYIRTVSPGIVLSGGALCLAAILRGLGDARRAMYVLLVMALVNVILDPILIFGFGLGLQGAAIAAVLGYLAALCTGLHGVMRSHRFFDPLRLPLLRRDFPAIWAIAYPAILSQLTVPVGNAYVTYVIARFGDEAVAGFAVISRLMPVAFGIAFALSNAVAPVIGQNFGAGLYHRVRETLTQSLIMSAAYTVFTSSLLFALSGKIAGAFNAAGETYDSIVFFCSFLAVSYFFVAALFIANAAFNNLDYARRAALLSWGRVTAGTIPFVYAGAAWAGWKGVLTGNAIGAVLFGAIAVAGAYRVTDEKTLRARHAPLDNG